MPIAIAVTIVEAMFTSAVGKRITMAGSKLSIAKSIPPATTHAATTVGNFKINLIGELVDSSSIDGSYFFIKKKGIAVTMSTSDTQKNGTNVVCPNSQIIAGPPAKPSDIETAYIAMAFGRIFGGDIFINQASDKTQCKPRPKPFINLMISQR